VVDLLQKQLLVLERHFESLVLALAFDRHPQEICRALEESDVLFAELACRSAVHFEHTVGRTIALQDDVLWLGGHHTLQGDPAF